MSDSLFREGGPHQIRRIGSDKYEMRVQIPIDPDGMAGRECPDTSCSPGYFKIKLGTGVTGAQTEAFCPYCQHVAEPNDFITRAQQEYAVDVMKNEALEGVNRMLSSALGLGPSGHRRIGNGLFSVEITSKPLRPRPVQPPREEVLRRDLTCPHCRLDHAVFGLATWCPDCGTDIFLSHVEQEMAVIRKMLAAVPARRSELGARVAARDVENALEDTVSIFEAVLKIVVRRLLAAEGKTAGDIEGFLEKSIRNQFQNVERAEVLFRDCFSLELLTAVEPRQRTAIARSFEKRHPITHNLGVVDRKYLERVRSGEDKGRDVQVTTAEVEDTLAACWQVFVSVYQVARERNAPDSGAPPSTI